MESLFRQIFNAFCVQFQKIFTPSMRTFQLTVLVLAFVSSLGICRGNLGDTEAQCLARYGQEFDLRDNLGFDVIGDKAVSFHVKTPKGSFLMKVIFLNGVACDEKLSNAAASGGLSEDQMKTILDLESAGLKWTRQNAVYHTDRANVTYGTQDWVRGDGATAKFWLSGKATSENESGQIELATRAYGAAQRDVDKQNGAN